MRRSAPIHSIDRSKSRKLSKDWHELEFKKEIIVSPQKIQGTFNVKNTELSSLLNSWSGLSLTGQSLVKRDLAIVIAIEPVRDDMVTGFELLLRDLANQRNGLLRLVTGNHKQ